MTITHTKRKPDTASNGHGGIQYHCDSCKRDITATVRVRCADCEGDFDLCVDCFRKGVEVGQHLNSHSYRLLDKHSNPLIQSNFGADEEYLLIEGVALYGLGNFHDIALHVGTKSLEECRDHYMQYYIKSKDFPLPQLSSQQLHPPPRSAHTKQPQQPVVNVLPPMQPKVAPSQPANHEIQGYMPGRGEFDLEVEQEAEYLVKDIQFNDDDSPVDVDLKLTVMEIYNQRLERRHLRKQFIADRHLTSNFKLVLNQEKRRQKDERDILQQTKPFATLMNNEDFQSLNKSLLVEQQLRERIRTLQNYRKNGITTFAAAEEYETQRKHRLSTLYTKTPFAGTSDRVANRQLVSRFSTGSSVELQKSAPVSVTQLNQSDILQAEGYNLLDSGEQQLCIRLKVLPRVYMLVKHTLLKDAVKRSDIKKDVQQMPVEAVLQVYDFMASKGWLAQQH